MLHSGNSFDWFRLKAVNSDLLNAGLPAHLSPVGKDVQELVLLVEATNFQAFVSPFGGRQKSFAKLHGTRETKWFFRVCKLNDG